MFTTSDRQRIAVSLLGATALSATCIAAAIVPARASAAAVTVVQAAPAAPAATVVTARPATGLVGAVRY